MSFWNLSCELNAGSPGKEEVLRTSLELTFPLQAFLSSNCRIDCPPTLEAKKVTLFSS